MAPMNATSGLSDTVKALVSDAAEWRMLQLLFQCPSEEWRKKLNSLAKEMRDADLAEAAVCGVRDASEGVFHSIFGPGGPAPAREASYQGTIQLGYLMSELCAYYDAFAYAPVSASPVPEPPDHVSVEAGFMSFLRLKQAFALSSGAEDEALITADAADRFLREHISNIAEPLSFALEHSGQKYLELSGKALLRRAGPARQQMFDILDQEESASGGCSFECGEP
jgi:nitrate reductase assembly molybdenum cofactor insertion protein NarJ